MVQSKVQLSIEHNTVLRGKSDNRGDCVNGNLYLNVTLTLSDKADD